MFCKVVFDVPLDRDFDYKIPFELIEKVRVGVRITAPLGRRLTCGIVTAVSEISTVPSHIEVKEIVHVVDEKPLFGSDLFPLARFMKNQWGGPIGQILFSLIPPQPFYKADIQNEPFFVPIQKSSFSGNPCQEHALQTLRENSPYTYQAFLFQGPKSDDKTEVILYKTEETLAAYGQTLLLVPDIVAARQFINEVEKRFGSENVFCWHSRMLLSKKKKYFSAVSNGRPCVVIGTRSAVLLPFKNLRFAALFDEGDDNYKQEENKPYYHTRDVLLFRAKMHETTLVFSSHTPSVELLKKVEEKQILSIDFNDSRIQTKEDFQLKLTPKKGEKSRLISDFLLAQLQENITRKQVSLLILNRRGYSNAYACLNCGAYAVCKKCGGILTREKSDKYGEILICKKCGANETLEQECPKCHNLIFKARGGGTQKIVTELAKLFPKARILRLDSDSLKTKQGQGFEALNALQKGTADMVVGTRLVAGALRGSKVTLAAVLDAELELDGPDFRAAEKYTQLLFELRDHLASISNGRLIIQTSQAEKYNYKPLIQGNFQLASQEEMELRQAFLYPPYARLIRVTIKGKDLDLIKQQTARLYKIAKGKTLEVLGPVWCAKKTDVLKKQYLLFKTDEERFLDLLACLDSVENLKKVTLQITADPYNFY